MRLQRQKELDARQLEKDEQKKRIEDAYLSLDRERAYKQRQKETHLEGLKFQSGQRMAEANLNLVKMQMEKDNDIRNIKKYTQKEMRNE